MSAALLTPLGRVFPQLKRINIPIDMGLTWNGSPLIGPSRTYLGLLVAFIVGALWFYIGGDTYAFFKTTLAFIGVVGASFIKRRLKIKSGARAYIMDQVDYLFITALIFYVFSLEKWQILLTALLITAIAHPVVCYVAYKLHLKDSPF
ncbi:MAG: CDP-archaeol synthase [Candidatus Pacebacteria bacterium]|nr:CDP-archaeol synthase [Candidatus Paceibacterota bacterium]